VGGVGEEDIPRPEIGQRRRHDLGPIRDFKVILLNKRPEQGITAYSNRGKKSGLGFQNMVNTGRTAVPKAVDGRRAQAGLEKQRIIVFGIKPRLFPNRGEVYDRVVWKKGGLTVRHGAL
jgi:hypothetical protein